MKLYIIFNGKKIEVNRVGDEYQGRYNGATYHFPAAEYVNKVVME